MAENASLLAKEAGLIARIVELEQTAKENAELKARVAKLEQKQLQNDISSNAGSSNSSFISPEDKEVDDFVDLKVKEKISNEIRDRNREKSFSAQLENKPKTYCNFMKLHPEIRSHDPKLIIIQ